MPYQENPISNNQNDPKLLARYFTYFIHQKKAGDYQINFANVQGKTTYSKWKKVFDTLAKISEKYGMEWKDYLYFCVYERGIGLYNASDILNINIIRGYAEHKQILAEYKKIRDYFIKSANYVVEQCLEKGYDSCKEFLKRQILHNTLAEKMISGKISIYYLATIKNIGEIVSKMNPISRDTFQTLVERSDKLNSDVQKAFMSVVPNKVNPIDFTDKLLFKKKNQRYTLK